MKLLFALLLMLLIPSAAVAKVMTEAEKINALIVSVETLPGAVFIRNGGEHDAKKAADHLRLKLRGAGRRVKTAEDFIRLCASESSLTGRKYRIRFANGNSVDSEQFLKEQLQRLEAAPAKPAERATAAKLH